MASSSRKREAASSSTGADAHFLSDVIRTADIDCMNIEKRTKFIKAQLDSMSDDQLTRYIGHARYFGLICRPFFYFPLHALPLRYHDILISTSWKLAQSATISLLILLNTMMSR